MGAENNTYVGIYRDTKMKTKFCQDTGVEAYENLDKHFTAPKRVSPLYEDVRLPRKMKKQLMQRFAQFTKYPEKYSFLKISQKRWWLLTNEDYKRFLIKKIIEKYEES